MSAGVTLWFWRQFVAQRFDARTTLMIANVIMASAPVIVGSVLAIVTF